MSEENEGKEENAGRSGSLGSDEFEFYFSFTKPLVLELPSSEDKAVAAAWVQKLEVEPASEEAKQQRLNYLKLLLFVLQRGRLSGIFKKQPPAGSLQPLPQGLSILDVGSLMLDQDDSQACGGGDARRVPYAIEISNDLREFVASQEVPNFGIQMYYAWSSDEPIHKWTSFDEEKFPQYIIDKIKQLKEIRSDEKSSVTKDVCGNKKRGCELTLPEKLSKKKVKTPQEIEKSQGRSFHAYMGLMGRVGNFSDKCDEDPVMCFQAQSQGRKQANRNVQLICPETRGEAQDTPTETPPERYEDAAACLNGVIRSFCASARSCLQQPCPENRPAGAPQPYMEQQTPDRICQKRGRRNEGGPPDRGGDFTGMFQGPHAEEQYFEDQCVAALSQNRTPAMVTSTPKHPRSRCPPEGNSVGFSEPRRVCVCTSPCTCPCPRTTEMPPPTSAAAPLDTVRGMGPGPGAQTNWMSEGLDIAAAARSALCAEICAPQPKATHCHDTENMLQRAQVKLWETKAHPGGGGPSSCCPPFKQTTKTMAAASFPKKVDLPSSGAPFRIPETASETSHEAYAGMRALQTQEPFYHPQSAKNAMGGFGVGLSQPLGMQQFGDMVPKEVFNVMSCQQGREPQPEQSQPQKLQRLRELCRKQAQQQEQQRCIQQCMQQGQQAQQRTQQQCIQQEQAQQRLQQQCIQQEQAQQRLQQQCIQQEQAQQRLQQQCIQQEQAQQRLQQQRIREEQAQQRLEQQCIQQEQAQQRLQQQCIQQEQAQQRTAQQCMQQGQVQQRLPQQYIQQEQLVQQRTPQQCIQQQQQMRSRSPQQYIQQEQQVQQRTPQQSIQQQQQMRPRSPQQGIQQQQQVRPQTPQQGQQQQVRPRSPQTFIIQEQVQQRTPQQCIQQQQERPRSPQTFIIQEQVQQRAPQQERPRSPQTFVHQEVQQRTPQQARPQSPKQYIQQEQQVRPRSPQQSIQQQQQARSRSPQQCIQQQQQVRQQQCIRQQVRPRSPQSSRPQEQQLQVVQQAQAQALDFVQQPCPQNYLQFEGDGAVAGPSNVQGDTFKRTPAQAPGRRIWSACCQGKPQADSKFGGRQATGFPPGQPDADGIPLSQESNCACASKQGAVKRVPREGGPRPANVQSQSQTPTQPHRRTITEGPGFPSYVGQTPAGKCVRQGPRTVSPQQPNAATQIFSPGVQEADFMSPPAAPPTSGNFVAPDTQRALSPRAQYANWLAGRRRTDAFAEGEGDAEGARGPQACPKESPQHGTSQADWSDFTEPEDPSYVVSEIDWWNVQSQSPRKTGEECTEVTITEGASPAVNANQERGTQGQQAGGTSQADWSDFTAQEDPSYVVSEIDWWNVPNQTRTLENECTEVTIIEGASPTVNANQEGETQGQITRTIEENEWLEPVVQCPRPVSDNQNRKTQGPGPGTIEDGWTEPVPVAHRPRPVSDNQNRRSLSPAQGRTVEDGWTEAVPVAHRSRAVYDNQNRRAQRPGPGSTVEDDWTDMTSTDHRSGGVSDSQCRSNQQQDSSRRVEDELTVLRFGDDESNFLENTVVQSRRTGRQRSRVFRDPRMNVQSKNLAYLGGNTSQNRKTQSPSSRRCYPANLGQNEMAQRVENAWGSGAPNSGAQTPFKSEASTPKHASSPWAERTVTEYLTVESPPPRERPLYNTPVHTFNEAEDTFREVLAGPGLLNRDLDLNPYLNRSIECQKKSVARRMCSTALDGGGFELGESFGDSLSAIDDAEETLVAPTSTFVIPNYYPGDAENDDDTVVPNTCVEAKAENDGGVYLDDLPQRNFMSFFGSGSNRNDTPAVGINPNEDRLNDTPMPGMETAMDSTLEDSCDNTIEFPSM